MVGVVGWIPAASGCLTGAIVVLVVVFLSTFAAIGPVQVWCDGAYEAWQLPDDYRGGGCASITPGTHAIFPWNWDADRTIVCLGMCLDSLTPPP